MKRTPTSWSPPSKGPDGAFDLIDFMPRYTSDGRAGAADDIGPDVVRKLRLLRGNPRIRVRFDPRLEYARGETRVASASRPGSRPPPSGDGDTGAVYESMYLWTNLDARRQCRPARRSCWTAIASCS